MASKRRNPSKDGLTLTKTAPTLKFWDDCADPEDIQALWAHQAVNKEWTAAGEKPGQKVHMSRTFEGPACITETEMRAIAEIIIGRFFTKIDPAMICAIAEIESARNPLAYRWEESVQEASTGLMQTLQSTADWLAKDLGYQAYSVDWASSMLYRPFVSVYFGCAYLKWLSTYDSKRRSEEFMVRGYNGGPKGATNKITLDYWNKYLVAKQNLYMKSDTIAPPLAPSVAVPEVQPESSKPKPWPRVKPSNAPLAVVHPQEEKRVDVAKDWTYWEEKCSVEDMEYMWRNASVKKEWVRAGERRGRVRFSRDTKMRPFLTIAELQAIAENIAGRFFSHRGISPVMLCSIAEISSNRLLLGLDGQSGILGLPFETALWLYRDMGYKSYRLKVTEDLFKPFVSMYFGAAYVCFLSNHGNRPRSDEFVVRGYKGGVDAVDDPETMSFWVQYLEAKSHYRLQTRKGEGSCCIQ
ncbi:hypothetical protein MPTK1_8g12060 [Marchantia polymorpha subsp. ruderalis]|uniref:Transglycosylase SLT domain-containing protein n=1 Tax=Marchantia polymorpha TaxID=3197 RepID=A0A2R6XMG8_MARPO|nr:hypothetical protein MARPO_0008s0010 [Marchantia polymorpha]BBN19609.1 hypothetical protein Mp_8g12060 [Marchantia polymorpha subsp. ruderalis]|eukprot:PTQ47216.1 hypothetical protein MARPO_0008s0010 [Marchantia polymorpha]